MLLFTALTTSELHAQIDGFFANATGHREEALSGLTFGNFSSGVGQGFNKDGNGLKFDDFTGKDDVPVGNGMSMMAAAGFLYLITKRRKENK